MFCNFRSSTDAINGAQIETRCVKDFEDQTRGGNKWNAVETRRDTKCMFYRHNM